MVVQDHPDGNPVEAAGNQEAMAGNLEEAVVAGNRVAEAAVGKLLEVEVGIEPRQ